MYVWGDFIGIFTGNKLLQILRDPQLRMKLLVYDGKCPVHRTHVNITLWYVLTEKCMHLMLGYKYPYTYTYLPPFLAFHTSPHNGSQCIHKF